MATSDAIEKLGFEVLESGTSARVVISARAKKVFDGLEVQQRGRLVAVLKRWCRGETLTEQMMNTNEGRTPKNKEMIQAFKAFKVRLYGFDRTIGGLRTFVIADVDPSKKQDKAGPVLDRAKKRVDEIIDAIDGKD